MSFSFDSPPNADSDNRFGFQSTRWSQVAAVRDVVADRRQLALSELCQSYWAPVYAFIRCRGYRAHDAQDLTQAFFAELLAGEQVAAADQNRGRFRTYLKTLVRNFLTDEHRAATALKRGGGVRTVSMDPNLIESHWSGRTEPNNPDVEFEREWANEVLRRVLELLEQEHRDKGRLDLWLATRSFLTPGSKVPAYDELSEQTGFSVTALKVAVHRTRERFRELLRATVSDTLLDPSETDAEILTLMQALAGN